MVKRTALLLAVIAGLVCASPAAAGAAPAITNEGKLMPVGTELTASSSNFSLETSLGTVTCEKVVANGKITENSGSSVKVAAAGGGSTTNCKVGSKAVTVTDFTISFSYDLFSGVTVEMTDVVHFPGGVTCHFHGPTGASVTIGGNHVTIGINPKLTGSPAACVPKKIQATLIWGPIHGGGLLEFD